MRIILLAAAIIGAAAIGTAAAARPGRPGPGPGPGAGPPSWLNAPGSRHGGKAGRTGFGSSPAKGDRRPGRGQGRFAGNDFYAYGGAGIVGPVGAVDPYGNGFFTGAGGQISLRGGRPHFDYDRSYPYEWGSAAGGRREGAVEEERASEPPPRCTLEHGVRVCRGW
ncbi:MAG TPA: hypothetical protein VEW26_02860 [Allosphingosinicella sp.]|nr:hypothetical protein [Allosphingosinicella sp.]